jgi:hypothetical protein
MRALPGQLSARRFLTPNDAAFACEKPGPTGLIVGMRCLVAWTEADLAASRPVVRPLVAQLPAQVLARKHHRAAARLWLLLAVQAPDESGSMPEQVSPRSAMTGG